MPMYPIDFSGRDFILKMKLYEFLFVMKHHSFSKNSTQLLITNWDVTHEAFEGNQIRYVQGCLGSGCSLCIGTVRESVLENT
jgi:ferredoxin